MPPAAIGTIIVSPIAREMREDERRDDARTAPRGRRPASTTSSLRRAQRVGALAQASAARRASRPRDSDETIGMIMMPITMPALKRVEDLGSPGDRSLQERRHERQREVAVDDGRDAGQDLEHRLQDRAHARRRVLAQVDRRRRARAGARPAQRSGRDERARSPAAARRSWAWREQRRPVGAREELAQATPRGRTRCSDRAGRRRSPTRRRATETSAQANSAHTDDALPRRARGRPDGGGAPAGRDRAWRCSRARRPTSARRAPCSAALTLPASCVALRCVSGTNSACVGDARVALSR